MDDQRIAVFAQIYLARVQALQDESQKSLHSGSPLIARTRRVY
jgi:23S rRNA A2030 N6-methylase RlmJ